MEDVPLHPPYALIVAAASLHWMHWETVLPRFHAVLTPGGYLAVVEVVTEPTPWQQALGFISAYSMNTDFQPYDILTVTQELAVRGLFEPHGITTTAPVPFRQSVAAYVESFDARNGPPATAWTRRRPEHLTGSCGNPCSGTVPVGSSRYRSGAEWSGANRAPRRIETGALPNTSASRPHAVLYSPT